MSNEIMNKTYKINYIRLIFDFVGAILIVAATIWMIFHIRAFPFLHLGFRFQVCMSLTVLIVSIFLLMTLFLTISKIEFDGAVMRINFLLLGKKTIDFSKIKDFSVFNKFRNINLYYIDNRKPENFFLFHFSQTDKKQITDNIAKIMGDFFMKYSEKQLDYFYEDESQYNFTATEKHITLFVFLASFFGFITFVTLLCIVLLLIYPPAGGIFSIIGEWFLWFVLGAWVIIFLVDAIVPKRTLSCENGVITLRRQNGKVTFSFQAKDVKRYWLNYKEFTWVLKQTPKKERTISLMGFSWKEKRAFRNKLESLILFA